MSAQPEQHEPRWAIRLEAKVDHINDRLSEVGGQVVGIEKSFEAHIGHYKDALERAFKRIDENKASLDDTEKVVKSQTSTINRSIIVEKIAYVVIGLGLAFIIDVLQSQLGL